MFSGDPVYVLIGGLFFVLSPPMTWLIFGHFPHLSHWLMLAGLDFYFRDTTRQHALRWFRPYWVLLAVAGGINPYLAALTFLIAMAALGRLLLERRCTLARGAVIGALSLAAVGASMLAFGFLATPDPSAYGAPGYGQFSLNLLSPINPMGHGSILIAPLPLKGMEQFEGYNYLGVGILGLLAVSVLRTPRALAWLGDTRLVPLVALAVVCTAAAVSSTVTLGSWTIVRFTLPHVVQLAAESLRVSGRLFWPAHYLLVLGTLSVAFWAWRPPYRTVIVVVALVIQVADVWTLRKQVRSRVDLPVEDPLRSDIWRHLGAHYANLMVIPAYQCGPYAAPGGKGTYAIFGKLASSQRMRTNSYYAARYTRRELEVNCLEVPGSLLRSTTLDRGTAYVVSDGVRAVWESTPVTSHRCERVDGFNLCTPATAASGSGPSTISRPEASPYTLGELVDFTARGGARKYLTYGWAASGEDGAWTNGPMARLRLGLSAPADSALAVVLVEGYRPFVSRQHRHLDVDVSVNGHTIDRWAFEYGDATRAERRAIAPLEMISGQTQLDLDLHILNPEAPANVGEGPDDRLLGLNVRGLIVKRQQ